MLSGNRQKGFIQLGIIGVIVLAAGLFVASKLASNPDLTFFNISEEAAGIEESSCKGCDGGRELRWDRNKKKCLIRASRKCGPAPTPKPSPGNGVPVNLTTSDVYLEAKDFYIFANGKKFGSKMANLKINSDSPSSGDPNYTTLEAIWNENGVEMRLFMYFYKNTEKWWVSEMRIYNGKAQGDWLIVKEPAINYSAKLGQYYDQPAGYLFANGDLIVGELLFGGLNLMPFRNSIQTPTPTSPPGCYYKEVQCIKAPCERILICPTPSPVSTPSSSVFCSCFGPSWIICDPSLDGQTDYVSYCNGGCSVQKNVAVCGIGLNSLKSGDICRSDSECQSRKCTQPGISPVLVNPPAGFEKVCQ